jgi:hypothetical protein
MLKLIKSFFKKAAQPASVEAPYKVEPAQVQVVNAAEGLGVQPPPAVVEQIVDTSTAKAVQKPFPKAKKTPAAKKAPAVKKPRAPKAVK